MKKVLKRFQKTKAAKKMKVEQKKDMGKKFPKIVKTKIKKLWKRKKSKKRKIMMFKHNKISKNLWSRQKSSKRRKRKFSE